MTVLPTEVKAGEKKATRLQWWLLKNEVVSHNGIEVDFKQFHKQVSHRIAAIAIMERRVGQSVEFIF